MIAPDFVDTLPSALYSPAFLDYAAALATRPGVWALWPGDEANTEFRFQRAGEVRTEDLGSEGPGGIVRFTRRQGRTYAQWQAL